MFHDRTLQNEVADASAFVLNAHACKLLMLVRWYEARGERTLPVSYLKRLFGRRGWEKATKGTRAYDGARLLDPKPAKDGLEAHGIVTEVRKVDPNDKSTIAKTYWVIGGVDDEALASIRAMQEIDQETLIEGEDRPVAHVPSECEATVPMTGQERELEVAYQEGEACGYSRGRADERAEWEAVTGMPKSASLHNSFRGADNGAPGLCVEGLLRDARKRGATACSVVCLGGVNPDALDATLALLHDDPEVHCAVVGAAGEVSEDWL